ncbi:MAG: hypothetical protein CMM50_17595 [Rhodospirillaceae bacterium]|nr:hypothetical protein [Rhodospirillaceae bacterium]
MTGARMSQRASKSDSDNGDASHKPSQNAGSRLEQAFSLTLSDLYEANAAVQICNALIHKHENLAAEPVEHQQVWGFIDQAVSWKLAMALERLTQRADKDRASLAGLLREIRAAKKNGRKLHDERRLTGAEEGLIEALDQEICKKLRVSRNAFMGHSLLGTDRVGVPLYDLIEFLGILEAIADDLHHAVFGETPPLDDHIERWQELAFGWFDWAFPPRGQGDD